MQAPSKILVFDQDGLIRHDKLPPCFSKEQQIIKESIQSHKHGKFFLLKVAKKDEYTILQVDKHGFSEILSNLSFEWIKN